ncbi:hypothetical protein KP79_PYT19528 [Mizuhopecten yessoensis]|uniref:Uncharacterized protein n=1 Tax=Mizuhopecten yessoensis TaxID=6573 RepID=A0A210R387_MIZYE|nr:hypothetical protein KP79_PYT19528 [Mizuhopecten yessoensis]
MASSGYPSSFTSITTEQVRDLRIKKLGGGNGDITGNSEHAAVQPSGKQETGEDQLHTPMDTSTNRSTEVDGEPPMTNVAGACARTHQMAITGTTLGRDPETYLCDSVGKTCVFHPTTGSQTVGHLRQPECADLIDDGCCNSHITLIYASLMCIVKRWVFTNCFFF